MIDAWIALVVAFLISSMVRRIMICFWPSLLSAYVAVNVLLSDKSGAFAVTVLIIASAAAIQVLWLSGLDKSTRDFGYSGWLAYLLGVRDNDCNP